MQAIAFYIVKSISDHIMCACGTCARKKKLSRKQPSELYVCLSFKVHLTINSYTHTLAHTALHVYVAWGQDICSLRAPCVLINYKTTRVTFISGARYRYDKEAIVGPHDSL